MVPLLVAGLSQPVATPTNGEYLPKWLVPNVTRWIPLVHRWHPDFPELDPALVLAVIAEEKQLLASKNTSYKKLLQEKSEIENELKLYKKGLQALGEKADTTEELLKEEQINHNQLVRWIDNKESHADEIQNIVSQYFMTQRIKPTGEDDDVAYKVYIMQITLLHRMLIGAMKAKQTTDLTAIEDLRDALEEFRILYFSGKKKR